MKDFIIGSKKKIGIEGSTKERQDASTAEDVRLVVQECGFSEEMQEYLVKTGIPFRKIDEVIAQAPISLEKKCDLLNTLFHKRNLNMHQRCYRDIMMAKGMIYNPHYVSIFYLFDEWGDGGGLLSSGK